MSRTYTATRLIEDFNFGAYGNLVGVYDMNLATVSKVPECSGKGSGFDWVQGTGANQPTILTADINGRNAVNFAASGQYMNGGSGLISALKNVAGASVFMVLKSAVASANQYALNISDGTSAFDGRAAICKNASDRYQAIGRTLDADSGAFAAGTTGGLTGYQVVNGLFDYQGGKTILRRARTQRSSVSSGMSSGQNTSNTNSVGATLGARSATNNGLNGAIAYMVIYSSLLTYGTAGTAPGQVEAVEAALCNIFNL